MLVPFAEREAETVRVGEREPEREGFALALGDGDADTEAVEEGEDEAEGEGVPTGVPETVREPALEAETEPEVVLEKLARPELEDDEVEEGLRVGTVERVGVGDELLDLVAKGDGVAVLVTLPEPVPEPEGVLVVERLGEDEGVDEVEPEELPDSEADGDAEPEGDDEPVALGVMDAVGMDGIGVLVAVMDRVAVGETVCEAEADLVAFVVADCFVERVEVGFADFEAAPLRETEALGVTV